MEWWNGKVRDQTLDIVCRKGSNNECTTVRLLALQEYALDQRKELLKCAVPPADATAAETLAALVNVTADAATNFIAEQAKTNRQREQDMKSMKKLEENDAMRRALAASANR